MYISTMSTSRDLRSTAGRLTHIERVGAAEVPQASAQARDVVLLTPHLSLGVLQLTFHLLCDVTQVMYLQQQHSG